MMLGEFYPLDDIQLSDLLLSRLTGHFLGAAVSAPLESLAEYDEAEQKERRGPKLNTTELGARVIKIRTLFQCILSFKTSSVIVPCCMVFAKPRVSAIGRLKKASCMAGPRRDNIGTLGLEGLPAAWLDADRQH